MNGDAGRRGCIGERVHAIAAVQQVRARSALDHVIAGIPEHKVIVCIAGQPVRMGRTVEPFEADDHVTFGVAARGGAATVKVDLHTCGGNPVGQPIITRPTVKPVSTRAANDVVVTMPVTINVTNQGNQKFFVAVAVTTKFEGPEALSDEIERTAPKGHTPLFAWVPANLYNSGEFGVFIDEAPIGEVLKNGLVNEIIEQAAVEETVISLNR